MGDVFGGFVVIVVDDYYFGVLGEVYVYVVVVV